ncbi:MAG TPA: hypothetical protein VE641_21675 [Chthoniobacterales bacterium]|nr:hypothetical protein [Chthoniobacterales bacterium]
MKLRLQFNSIRLRLKRSEVEQFSRTGRVEEKISLGTGDDETFRYILESTASASTPRAVLTPREVIVQVPPDTAMRWASTDQIGIESEQPVDNQISLRILIEKDFACIDGTDEENADTFPNPLAEEGKLPEILPDGGFSN